MSVGREAQGSSSNLLISGLLDLLVRCKFEHKLQFGRKVGPKFGNMDLESPSQCYHRPDYEYR